MHFFHAVPNKENHIMFVYDSHADRLVGRKPVMSPLPGEVNEAHINQYICKQYPKEKEQAGLPSSLRPLRFGAYDD